MSTHDLARLARLLGYLALLGFLVVVGGRVMDQMKATIVRT